MRAGRNSVTIFLAEGVYAVNEAALFKPTNRSFTKENRLTIRAEVLPDEANWSPQKVPVLTHTMPLSPLIRVNPHDAAVADPITEKAMIFREDAAMVLQDLQSVSGG